MSGDLVIGIDASTTATKAIAWTAAGQAVAEGRAPVALSQPLPNHYEQDPADWWSSCAAALRQVTASVDPARIAALSVSNQRETFAPFAADGSAIRPGMVWLDERARGLVDELAALVGTDPGGTPAIHRISGKPVDVIPVANRIFWMLRHEPDNHAAAAIFADVQALLCFRLTGRWATSWASADPLGLFDMAARRWSPEILAACGIDAARLPAAERPGSILGAVTAAAAAETGLARGTPVVAGGGDGQLAGLGCNALTPDTAYLNIGTALVSGIYSPTYRNAPAWRSMGSPTGDGMYAESCLRGGTFTVTWFLDTICQGETAAPADLLRRLEGEAAAIPAGAQGLLMLPYWQGVMAPHWNSAARGAFIGLSGAHGRAHMYRALMEGLALEQHLSTAAAETALGQRVDRFVAIGGGASSGVWRQIFADATGKEVHRSDTVEASSLGAGICAAIGAGWHGSFAGAAAAMTGRITAIARPDPDTRARYADLFATYAEVYARLKPLYPALDRLAGAR
jgi:xylulokinase